MCEVPAYGVRPMRREEIPAVLDLWRETHLAEGTYTIDTFFDYDPEGFYVAVTEEDEEVIGSCAGVLQNPELAFVGLYVVKSAYQKRGIGRKIWDTVMQRVGERNSGVNPVPDQLANYRDKSGFPVQTSWSTVVSELTQVDLSRFAGHVPGVDIRELTSDGDIEAATEYDGDVLGFSRGNLVPLMCAQKETVSVAAYCDGGVMCGYGRISINIDGNALVGPLFADDAPIAEAILCELVKRFPIAEEKGLTMMTVDCNEAALELMERLGFIRELCVARLYRREEVEVKYNKVFGQTNLNFSIF